MDFISISGVDVALHVNLRADEKAVVLNHQTGPVWGDVEERFPLIVKPGQEFSLHIRAQPQHFEVGLFF